MLRAGDALHLTVCADQGVTLCTLDRRLAEVGPRVAWLRLFCNRSKLRKIKQICEQKNLQDGSLCWEE